MTRITLPPKLKSIGSRCFIYSSIEEINLPSTLEIIGDSCFSNTLLSSIKIPESISIINAGTFQNCENLKTVILPSSLSVIGLNSFQGCINLTEIVLPNSLTTIAYRAFANSGIMSIEIPKQVKILEQTFFDCHNLEKVELGYSIEIIKNAFTNAQNIREIIINNPFPPLLENTHKNGNFDKDVYLYSTLWVPYGTKEIYSTNNAWGNFWNIEEMPRLGATQIILNVDLKQLNIGESFQLEAIVLPEETTDKTIIWSSSNEDVAYVSEEGLVTAFSAGEAIITGACGEVSATCVISVINPVIEANQIILNIEEIELNMSETLQLEAKVLPENTTDKTIIWFSSNTEVATVSEDGLVVAISEGTAIITATCGEVSVNCEITVVKPIIEAEQIILNIKEAELNIGETVQLEATVLPENATDKSVSWESSDSNVATVSENGLVESVSAGNAIITANCGEVSAECAIIVLEDSGVESLLANPNSKISVYSVDGILITKDCKVEDLKTLSKGIYIIVSGQECYKISI